MPSRGPREGKGDTPRVQENTEALRELAKNLESPQQFEKKKRPRGPRWTKGSPASPGMQMGSPGGAPRSLG